MIRFLPYLLALAMLLGIGAQRQSRPARADAGPFHDRVREAVRDVPVQFGEWRGEDVPVPQAAHMLLRPNAIFARAYYHPARRQRATLVIVQCKDSRDMIGHYPPACYPAHGWTTVGESGSRSIDLGHRAIPVQRFAFAQHRFDRRADMVIYAFFVLPGRGIVHDMREVRKASSDYLTRGFGAAQVQVLLDAGLSPEEEISLFRELMTPVLPMIDLLESGPAGAAS